MSEKTPEPVQNNQLSRLLSSHMLELLEGKGLDLLQQVGTDVIRQILLDILSGKNLRDSTELLTRSRIASLNIALTSLFVKGVAQSPDFVRNLPALAADILSQKKLSKADRQIGGSIVQMSATFWPQEVARLLKKALSFDHPLIDMEHSRIEDYLKEKLQAVPLESFLRNLPTEDLIENEP